MPLKEILRSVAVLCFSSACLVAQTTSPPQLVVVPPASGVVGGVFGGVILGSASGSGPVLRAVTGQPYSLVKMTNSVRTLGDGTKITNVREEHQMRDSDGRVRTEVGHIKDGQFTIDSITLSDPEARTYTTLFVRTKTGHITHLSQPTPQTPEQKARQDELRATAVASRKENPTPAPARDIEKLSPQNIAGVYAEGMRVTHMIPAGTQGNDRDIKTVMETWTSPDLKITLQSTMDDPRFGTTTTQVTELQRADPSPQLFAIPADYKVIDSSNGAGAPTQLIP